MSLQPLLKKLLRETLVGVLMAGVVAPSLFTGLLLPVPEAEAASNMCRPEDIKGFLEDPNYEPIKISLLGKIGGVKLDQAATFLADMSDITGAYYDQIRDQIVFVGKTETAVPKFDKDDLAVAIKSIFLAEANPGVKIEYVSPEDPGVWDDSLEMNVNYMPSKTGDIGTDNNPTGYWEDENKAKRAATPFGIEDTAFAKILFDADYKLKQFYLGYAHGLEKGTPQRMETSVSGYASQHDIWLSKNPDKSQRRGAIRVWLSPQKEGIVVKRDEAAQAFVFDKVTMEVTIRDVLGQNDDPKWLEAAQEFAQHHTANFDKFAAENPSYEQVKRLTKIVGVVKWLKDNNIPSDFNWARDYEPAFVKTERKIPMIRVDEGGLRIGGGLNYFEGNTYVPDNGTSAALKTSAIGSQPSPADFHWNFNKDGQAYKAVAVSAEVFRNAGAYSTQVTDLGADVIGDNPLALARSYSSQNSGAGYGFGHGWDPLPARLTDIGLMGHTPDCTPQGTSGALPYHLAFQNQSGMYETFTYKCTGGFTPDDPSYTSRVTAHDSIFDVTLKNHFTYSFDQKTLHLFQVADQNGNRVTFEYGGVGGRYPNVLSAIQDTHGHWLGIVSQDAAGRVTTFQDWAGRKVQYQYDEGGRLAGVTDLLGRVTQYQYDSLNRLTGIIDPAGQNVLALKYNELNKVTAQTDALGRTINMAYDENNRTLTASDGATQNKFIYDDKARMVEEVDALGKSTKYTYGTWRAPETVTDKRGNVKRYQYDARGNTTKVTTPDGLSADTAYNSTDLPTQITDNHYSPGRVITFTYDGKFNVTQQSVDSASNQFTYDQYGQLAQATQPLGQKTTYQYNSFGQPTAVTDALGNKTLYEYDATGFLIKQIDPAGTVTTFTHDSLGKILTAKDAIGTTTYIYDNLDRLTRVMLPDGTSAQYNYNTAGQITKVTDSKGSVTTYTYDARGNLVTRKNAAGKEYKSEYDALSRLTKALTPLGKATQAAYDAAGNVTQATDPAGQATIQQFDALNRSTKSTLADQSAVTRTYDGRGNLTQASDPSGNVSLIYDQFDRLTKSTDPFGNAVQYAYDASGRRTSLTYPSGQKVNYGYNANDELTSVTDWNNQATQLTYYPNGLLKDKKLSNGITAHYDYDSANRMNRLTYLDGSGQPLAQTDIERSLVGNVTKLIESGPLFTQPIGTPPSPTPVPSSSPTPTPTPTPPPPPPPPSGDLTFTLQTDQAWGIDVGSNAAPTIADLDNDGKLDLLVGEYSGNINHYEQTGTQPTDSFALVTSNFFNIDAGNYSKPELADIDGDGDLDLFIGGYYGRILFYPNTGSASQPSFSSTGTLYNSIDVGDYSAPRWVDIDADGDLDLFIGSYNGTLTYYKNTGSKSSAQLQLSSSNFSGIDIGSHSTPFFADFDKDQDLDLVIGTSDGKIKYYKNTGTAQAATFTLVSTIASNVDVGSNSAPAARDLTGDGLPDLLIGDSGGNLELWVASNTGLITAVPDTIFFGLIPIAHAQAVQQFITTFTYDALGQLTKAAYPDGKTFDYGYDAIGNRVGNTYDADAKLLQAGNATYTYDANGAINTKQENNKTTGYAFDLRHQLTRVGDGQTPPESWELAFTRQTDKAWGIDVGSDGSPAIGDLDNDGKLDLLIGESSGNVNHYEQTEAKSDAAFTLVTDKISGIDIGSGSAPALVDIDADSDLDLFIGTSTGVVYFYRNTGSAQQPAFTLESNKFSNIDVGDYAIPRFADIDADGDLDFFIGAKDGTIKSYKNFGTKQQATFTLDNNQYANIDIGDYATPTFVNLDSDKDVDLLIGKSDGTIVFYKNNGTAQAATFQLQETKFQGIDVGSDSVPMLQNLTSDSLPDLLVGDSTGVLELYAASKKVTTPPDPAPKFTHDALGNRIKKIVNGSETRYVNDISGKLPYVLAELNSSNQSQSLNLYATGLTSFGPTTSSSRLYPLTDPLGNVRFVLSSNGTLLARYAYDPYGNIRSKEGTTNSAFTFAGEQFDPETSLTFLRARYYDPSTGTFLSRDPVLGPLNTPIEHGEYLYARNNPVNLSDPSGEATYRQNRRLFRDELRSNYNPLTHTLLFTTKQDGTLEHTYSWTNPEGWIGWWVMDLTDDRTAANAALKKGKGLNQVGPDELDPYINNTFQDWQDHPLHVNRHAGIVFNCKQEADLLLIEAKRRMREDSDIMMSRYR